MEKNMQNEMETGTIYGLYREYNLQVWVIIRLIRSSGALKPL